MSSTNKVNIKERCLALGPDMSLENLFEITFQDASLIGARAVNPRDNALEIVHSYGDIRRRATAMAAYAQKQIGLKKAGGYVGLQLDTQLNWVPLFWALIMAGYPVILLDAQLTDEMTDYLLTESGAVGLVTKARRTLGREVVQIVAEDIIAHAEDEVAFSPTFANAVALCTSGTTDTSRIFVYNGEAIAHQVLNTELLAASNQRIISDTPHTVLAFLPFHHVFGFMVNVLWSHFLGFETVYMKDRAPETIMGTAQRFKITFLCAVPLLANNLSVSLMKKVAKEKPVKRWAFYAMRSLSLGLQKLFPLWGSDFARNKLFRPIVERILGTDVKVIILGGSHTPREHMRTISALGYYTVNGFGMTETAITSVETGMKLKTRTSGSVGRPFTSVEYRVISDGTSSNVGEMAIRGQSVHTGRLVGGQLTPPTLDRDGWYLSGDVVRLEKGMRMYVEGRIKDVIIGESGENVYPDEIEDHFGLLEGVDQYSVLGVKNTGGGHVNRLKRRKHKGVTYEDVTLVVSVGERYRDDDFLISIMRQVAQINGRLPVLKRITRLLATPDKLPVANGIKVKRLYLKAQIEEKQVPYRDLDLSLGHLPPDAEDKATLIAEENKPQQDRTATDIKEKVRQVYADTLDISPNQIADSAHFITDLGGDSLQVLSLSLKIEDLFSILIPVEDYGLCTTVNDLTALLVKRMQGDKEPEDLGPVTPISRFEDSPEFKRFAARQEALLGHGLENPYFVVHDSPLTDVSVMAGETVLNFGSYNYAGMSGRPEVVKAAQDAAARYGTSASGSRLLAGEKSLTIALEEAIARWKHTEAALVLVGGHSTNVTFVGNFCGKRDLIVYDALAHNSVAEGCRLSDATSRPFPHNDYKALENILMNQRAKYEKVLIVIEGAYSMDGDIPDVPAFVALKKKYGCFLMVDEAHSAGVLGPTGAGVDEYFGLKGDDIDIKMGTLSKGLGTCGGYLAGKKTLIEYLKYNLPGFVFSVGISPPLAAATKKAVELLQEDPAIMKRMQRNITCFVEEAHKRNLNTCLAADTAIIPILVGQDADAFLLSNALRHAGVFVPPAVYPAVPQGKARLRFCVVSEHKPEQIVQALDTLVATAKELGITLPPWKEGGETVVKETETVSKEA